MWWGHNISDYIYEWRKYNYYISTLMVKYLYYCYWDGVWWNQIDEQLILGAIPLHNLDHLQLIEKENIDAVISVVEDFELKQSIYFKPITQEDWKKNNIKVLQISAEDTKQLNTQQIRNALEFIRQNKKTYLHCKKGVGRSASIALAYLIDKNKKDILENIQILKNIRPEINMSQTQIQSIHNWINDTYTDVEAVDR